MLQLRRDGLRVGRTSEPNYKWGKYHFWPTSAHVVGLSEAKLPRVILPLRSLKYIQDLCVGGALDLPLSAAAMAAPAPALPNVQLSFGPMLLGVFANMILFGILIGQVLTYYRNYRHDAFWMRLFVSVLFFIETCNTGFDMAFMYQPLILEYGQKPNLFPTFFVTQPLCVVLISTPIQLFFAWRIRSLTKSYWVPGVIAVLSFASLAGGVWTAVMIRIVKTFANKPKLHDSALLWFLSSCVADLLITVSLVFSLTKRKTGFSGTDSVIDKIIRMTIQTGMLTAVFSILDVVCFMVLPHAAINFIWDLALSKLYTNCLMSTLNARQGLNNVSSGKMSEQRRNVSHGGLNPTSPTSRRQRGDTFLDNTRHHLDSSGIYELDTQKGPYDMEAGYGNRDHGYGVQVTKVVERVEDPPVTPHPYVVTQ
ncbi:hypothetical protein FB45DRAFT_316606 [Roridomyces roridus]|uniref:DUF6534 domain-containing protein n=1 Tax=Roridomyces roridus TaxID=1738132 RepID=A0AAD7FA82_9AGAR|nr:hypothetical protein FB45DRAFT_316606 [Roridomyces roridus]